MKRVLCVIGIVGLTLCVCVGCSEGSSNSGKSSKKAGFGNLYGDSSTKTETSPAPTPSANPSVSSTGGATTATTLPGLPGDHSGPAPATQPEVRHATGSVTGRGQDLGNNPISTPIKTYFMGKEKISFDIQIPHAMQLYQAANGYYPRTAVEFWDNIIVPNQIPLPELPQGDYYQYDAQSGQLMVKHFPDGVFPPQDPSMPPGFTP